MQVYLGYATAESQTVIALTVAPPCTVAQLLADSRVLAQFGALNTADLAVGIYGKQCAKETELKPFDRVEIYSPLLVTPIEARRLRAANNPTALKNRQGNGRGKA